MKFMTEIIGGKYFLVLIRRLFKKYKSRVLKKYSFLSNENNGFKAKLVLPLLDV